MKETGALLLTRPVRNQGPLSITDKQMDFANNQVQSEESFLGTGSTVEWVRLLSTTQQTHVRFSATPC